MINQEETIQLVKLMDHMSRQQIKATINYLNERYKTAENKIF